MLIATIQARTGSSRYPGKVMEDVAGLPMIVQQYNRIKSSNLFEKILVATTDSPKDDLLCQILEKYSIAYFRGSELDVLGRLNDCLAEFPAEATHIEFTGDAPMADPKIVRFLLKQFISFSAKGGKFLTNGKEITFPNGTEMCIYKLGTLRFMEKLTDNNDGDREDVDKIFYKHLKPSEICNITAPQKWKAPDLYVEVDELIDIQLVRAVFEHFHLELGKTNFGIDDVIKFLKENPAIAAINRKVPRKYWNYKK